MVNESRSFGAATLLTLAGLGVLLYGVYLDSGMEINVLMAVGGALLFGAITTLTAGIMLLDEGHVEA